MISFPGIDPVAFYLPEIMGYGPFPIRWYGLAYIAGFFLGLLYFKYLLKRRNQPAYGAPISPTTADDLFVWVILGVILGGRLGYVLFYNPLYYFEHPQHIYALWQGGMSYHGGMLGVFIATLFFALNRKIHFFDITDRIAPAACIGLFFGRMANFVNGELWGRVSDVPWAMVFPHGGPLPRHPSQLYEAVLEGLLLFLVLHFVAAKRGIRRYELSGLFMLGYGTFRSLVELVREPDPIPHLQEGVFQFITMGQVLSLPMVVVGIVLLALSRNQPKATSGV